MTKWQKKKLEMLGFISVHPWRCEMQDMQHLFLSADQTVMIRRVSSGDREALILTCNFETVKLGV